MISLLIRSNRVKKIESNVDNCPGFSAKRYQMICQIQKFLKEAVVTVKSQSEWE